MPRGQCGQGGSYSGWCPRGPWRSSCQNPGADSRFRLPSGLFDFFPFLSLPAATEISERTGASSCSTHHLCSSPPRPERGAGRAHCHPAPDASAAACLALRLLEGPFHPRMGAQMAGSPWCAVQRCLFFPFFVMNNRLVINQREEKKETTHVP